MLSQQCLQVSEQAIQFYLRFKYLPTQWLNLLKL